MPNKKIFKDGKITEVKIDDSISLDLEPFKEPDTPVLNFIEGLVKKQDKKGGTQK